jgi:hypothetical protein
VDGFVAKNADGGWAGSWGGAKVISISSHSSRQCHGMASLGRRAIAEDFSQLRTSLVKGLDALVCLPFSDGWSGWWMYVLS